MSWAKSAACCTRSSSDSAALRFEILMKIKRPARTVDTIDEDFLFNVLSETVCTMDLAETQLLRGWDGQIVKAACI